MNRDSVIAESLQPHIKFTGNTVCVVEGLRRILAYTQDMVKMDLGKYAVTFTGAGLCIESLSYEAAVLVGTIMAVEFSGNG